MGEFECQTHRAQFTKPDAACALKLRIYQGGCAWGRNGHLVMIQHEHINAALLKPFDRGDGCRPAIDREQQGGIELHQAILDAFLAQAITFLQSVRQIVIHLPAQSLHDFD